MITNVINLVNLQVKEYYVVDETLVSRPRAHASLLRV
jgi:hypothetical protein